MNPYRYLLQLFTEADCLDWALVLALVLRDAMAVLRLVSMARSSLTNASPGAGQASTIEIVTRLRDGLLALSHWVMREPIRTTAEMDCNKSSLWLKVETECQGYRQFMNVIYGQIGTLTKLILPATSSPKPSDAGGFNFQETPTSVAKSRHSSVSMMTPLNAVLEEAPSDLSLSTSLPNGSLPEPPHRSETKTSGMSTNNHVKESLVKSSSIEPIHPEHREQQQSTSQQPLPTSSSCVIS